MKIGVNIGKTNKKDRGISVYTYNILKEFNKIATKDQFTLLHHPNSAPNDTLGLANTKLAPLFYSNNTNTLSTLFFEQLINPIQQKFLDLDVIWHPHNRSQFVNTIPYVTTLHDILPIARPDLAEDYLHSWQKKLLYWTRTRSATQATRVITLSDFSKNEIVKYLGIKKEKVTTIYNGVNLDIFKPNTDNTEIGRIRHAYSIPKNYILTTGSYAPHKNQVTILEAYRKSGLQKNNICLVMVGPNDATGYKLGYKLLKEKVHAMSLTDYVFLLPSVPITDLVIIYSNAKLFVSASLYEGFGLTPLEAMACEIPTIVSDTSALPEICGKASIYNHPLDVDGFAENFIRACEDNSLRKSLILAGTARCKLFSWETTAKKTLEVLHSVGANL